MRLRDKAILSFDCFGTLVDWETGIWEALQPLFQRAGVQVDRDVALQWYAHAEAHAEAGTYRAYRSILRSVLQNVGSRVDCVPTGGETDAFCSSLARWPIFPDTRAALSALKPHFRLAVITNCDDELFAGVRDGLGTELDVVVTAEQARAYKPSLAVFHLAIDRLAVPVDRILHVACSLYHDHVPARQLGIASAWINRRHGDDGLGATPEVVDTVTPDLVFHDLKSFASFALSGAG